MTFSTKNKSLVFAAIILFMFTACTRTDKHVKNNVTMLDSVIVFCDFTSNKHIYNYSTLLSYETSIYDSLHYKIYKHISIQKNKIQSITLFFDRSDANTSGIRVNQMFYPLITDTSRFFYINKKNYKIHRGYLDDEHHSYAQSYFWSNELGLLLYKSNNNSSYGKAISSTYNRSIDTLAPILTDLIMRDTTFWLLDIPGLDIPIIYPE